MRVVIKTKNLLTNFCKPVGSIAKQLVYEKASVFSSHLLTLKKSIFISTVTVTASKVPRLTMCSFNVFDKEAVGQVKTNKTLVCSGG